MPRSDRWSPEDSRERYRYRHGQRDHSRSDNRRTYKQGFSRERSTIGRNRRGERGRSRERYMLSRDRYRRRAGPKEWPDRSTRRKRSRSREGCVISQRSSRRENTTNQHGNLLRNRGREPSHPYEFGERNSTHSHSQSQNTVNASKILNNVRARVVRTHSLPMYLGPSHQGERTISNSAVLFQTHVSRILATAEGGIFALPQDREVKSVWRAQPDAFISKRRELLSDLLADYLPTHCQLTACQPVVVCRISGQRETMQVQQVTITDWLRLLVREEGLDWGAKEAALEALDAIAARPDEPRLSVTARLVSAFRTTMVDPDRPHATETAFFWRYVSERNLKDLMERLAQLLLPSHLEPYGVIAITVPFLTKVGKALRTYPVEPQNPMGYSMRMRGNVAHDLFYRYAAMLSDHVPGNDEIHRRHRPRAAAIKTQPVPLESVSDHASENAELRLLLRDARESLYLLTTNDSLIRSDNTPKTLPRAGVAPPRSFAAACQPAPLSLPVIKYRAATIPGQHEVPFLQRGPRDEQWNNCYNTDEESSTGAYKASAQSTETALRRV